MGFAVNLSGKILYLRNPKYSTRKFKESILVGVVQFKWFLQRTNSKLHACDDDDNCSLKRERTKLRVQKRAKFNSWKKVLKLRLWCWSSTTIFTILFLILSLASIIRSCNWNYVLDVRVKVPASHHHHGANDTP